MQTVDSFDHEENDESGQQKLYDQLNKVSVSKYRGCGVPGSLKRGIRIAVERQHQVCKINFAGNQGNDRHNNVPYQGIDNTGKSTADNDTDCHIHDISTHDKSREF